MDTNHAPVTPQLEIAHELNPGGIEPITVDAPAARPPRPERPVPTSQCEGIDGALIIIALCALAVFALGFVGGVMACKAGGW